MTDVLEVKAKRTLHTHRDKRGTFRWEGSRATGWGVVLLLLVFWQIYGTLNPAPALSTPVRIFVAWVGYLREGDLIQAVGDTLYILLIGYTLALVIGVTVGFLMGRVSLIWGLCEPIVEIIRTTPASSLIPLFILFLGIGDAMKVAVLLCGATFPILLNSMAGARNVSTTLDQTADTFGLSWWRKQVEVALPAAIPFIVVGMRQALAASLVLAVVTGMLAGDSGIGYFILQAQQTLNPNGLFSGILTISIVGYSLNALFLYVEKKATPWLATSKS